MDRNIRIWSRLFDCYDNVHELFSFIHGMLIIIVLPFAFYNTIKDEEYILALFLIAVFLIVLIFLINIFSKLSNIISNH